MGKPVTPPSGGAVETIHLKEALEERYLAYALSTIMARSLPDVRDLLRRLRDMRVQTDAEPPRFRERLAM